MCGELATRSIAIADEQKTDSAEYWNKRVTALEDDVKRLLAQEDFTARIEKLEAAVSQHVEDMAEWGEATNGLNVRVEALEKAETKPVKGGGKVDTSVAGRIARIEQMMGFGHEPSDAQENAEKDAKEDKS